MSVLFIDDGMSGRKIELSIYKVGTSYLLLKRSKMESPNIIIAMITAFSTVMVTLLGKVGFDRYKAKGETTCLGRIR